MEARFWKLLFWWWQMGPRSRKRLRNDPISSWTIRKDCVTLHNCEMAPTTSQMVTSALLERRSCVVKTTKRTIWSSLTLCARRHAGIRFIHTCARRHTVTGIGFLHTCVRRQAGIGFLHTCVRRHVGIGFLHTCARRHTGIGFLHTCVRRDAGIGFLYTCARRHAGIRFLRTCVRRHAGIRFVHTMRIFYMPPVSNWKERRLNRRLQMFFQNNLGADQICGQIPFGNFFPEQQVDKWTNSGARKEL